MRPVAWLFSRFTGTNGLRQGLRAGDGATCRSVQARRVEGFTSSPGGVQGGRSRRLRARTRSRLPHREAQ